MLENDQPPVNTDNIPPVIIYEPYPVYPNRIKKPYPSIGASIGLLGILLGFSLVGGVILGILLINFPEVLAPGFMVVYIGSFVLALWLGLIFRRNRKFSSKGGKWYLWPLIFLLTLLFVIVREPMVYLWNQWEGKQTDLLSGLDILNPYIIVVTVIAAPVFEELIFRGIILDGFLKRYKPWAAIFISSLIFAIAHLNIPQFINALMIGLLMGWIYWKTASLFLTILIHFINNLSATVLEFYNNKYAESAVQHVCGSTLMYLLIYFGSLVFGILLLFGLVRIFRRSELKDQYKKNSEIKISLQESS